MECFKALRPASGGTPSEHEVWVLFSLLTNHVFHQADSLSRYSHASKMFKFAVELLLGNIKITASDVVTVGIHVSFSAMKAFV